MLSVLRPLFVTKIGFWPLLILCGQLLFLNHSAHADVWAYVDDKGITHFAPEQLNPRYEVFFRGDESLDAADGLNRSGLSAAGTSPVVTFFEISPGFRAIRHHVREASKAQKIDYELLQAIIATESGFDAQAVSPKGAIGLMQVMPATAERFGVAADKQTPIEKKLADPGTNILAGSRYLGYLLGLFSGQLELAVAAYNAGEGAVQRAGNQIPNFKETQHYVKTVMQLYRLLKPPAQLEARRQAGQRIRVAFGGAVNRNHMPAAVSTPVPAAAQAFHLNSP